MLITLKVCLATHYCYNNTSDKDTLIRHPLYKGHLDNKPEESGTYNTPPPHSGP